MKWLVSVVAEAEVATVEAVEAVVEDVEVEDLPAQMLLPLEAAAAGRESLPAPSRNDTITSTLAILISAATGSRRYAYLTSPYNIGPCHPYALLGHHSTLHLY